MASHLSNISKMKHDHIVKKKDTSTVSTSHGVQLANQSTESNNSVQNLNSSTSMLDNIPFVFSRQTNVDFNYYNCELEGTKNYLLSVKNVLASDVYNYDFSNEKRIVNEGAKYFN